MHRHGCRHLAYVPLTRLIVIFSVGWTSFVTAQSATPVSKDEVAAKAKEAGEVERALAAVGSGSARELKSRLFTDRITIFDEPWRQQALAALPNSLQQRRIIQGKLLTRVERIFQQTLELHSRGGQVELFFYEDAVPSARLWRGCVLLLASGLAEPLYDGELAGIMAHELGHSYFEDEMAAAQSTKDDRQMRIVELKCDAVAILTLELMGYEPAHYVRGLQRIEVIIKRRGRSSGILQSHPDLVLRLQFSQRFIKSLG